MKDDLGPYSRVYWSVRSDEKFRGIYANDNLLATWLRLLISADAIWPEPADLPSSCRKVYYHRLVTAGLLDDLGGGQYRIHGLDAERSRRAEHAKTASNARWNARSNAASNAPAFGHEMPSQSQVQAEAKPSTSRAEDAPSTRAPDPADVYWTLTGRYPNDKPLSWLDDMTATFGAEAVIRALASCHTTDRSTQTLLGRTNDVLKAEARALSLKDRAAEKERLEAKRAEPRQVVDPEAVRRELETLLRRPAA